MEGDVAEVGLGGADEGGGEVGVIGGVGEVLTFDGDAVVVAVRTSRFAGGASGEPVAGVDLDAGLVGTYGEGTACGFVVQHGYGTDGVTSGRVCLSARVMAIVAFTGPGGGYPA